MKTLVRNKSPFYYALYQGKTAIIDEYGNKTGEYEVTHSSPIRFQANISAAKGETQTQQFGDKEDYDKVIVMDNTAPLMDEYSVLWIDRLPEIDSEGKTVTPYDYVVRKIAKSLNSVSVAVSKVNVT